MNHFLKYHYQLKNGKKVTEEQGVADAHPYGARPFKRKNYINKFLTLTENILSKKESNKAKYICSKSRILLTVKEPSIVSSRICSKLK